MPKVLMLSSLVAVAMLAGCAHRSSCFGDWEFSSDRPGLVDDESALWIPEEVARCLAAEYGLEEGIRPWRMILSGGLWYIQNTLYDDGPNGMGGREITLDGETGEVIRELDWNMIS
jgi:hypothetical protein